MFFDCIYLYMKIIITESQLKNIVESHDKEKKFLKDNFGIDFSNGIELVTGAYDIPMIFDDCIGPININLYLNHWGPMYVFEFDGTKYLYQDRGEFEWFMSDGCWEYVYNEIPEQLGIAEMGLKFSDIIDIYFEEQM